jgi:DNA-binding NarL/FixJ family response regulator
MEPGSAALQVYIVEDSAILGQLLERTVEAAGGKVVGRTGDAAKAIADLKEQPADLVVLDIMLDAGSGFEVLKSLTQPGPAHGAFKLVLTNYSQPQYRRESFALGADCFFDKSTEAWQAIEVINRLGALWPHRGEERPSRSVLCPNHSAPSSDDKANRDGP